MEINISTVIKTFLYKLAKACFKRPSVKRHIYRCPRVYAWFMSLVFDPSADYGDYYRIIVIPTPEEEQQLIPELVKSFVSTLFPQMDVSKVRVWVKKDTDAVFPFDPLDFSGHRFCFVCWKYKGQRKE